MHQSEGPADSEGEAARMQVFGFAPATLVDSPPRLQLESGEEMPATDLLQNLSAEGVVAVCFGKFSDGRGFSLGRRLRSSLSRDHLIVASGHIIPDGGDAALSNGGGVAAHTWRVVPVRFDRCLGQVRSRQNSNMTLRLDSVMAMSVISE